MFKKTWILVVLLGSVLPLRAVNLLIVNPGFEDISGQTVFNEFTFGTPTGWTLHDPNNLVPDPDVFVGTLFPNGVEFFPVTAPEGDRVALLYNSTRKAEGEYGYFQELTDMLQANTQYSLTVQVGNITSGTAVNSVVYDLSNFPGYRIDLLAGGTVIASDTGAAIDEGQWALRTVIFNSDVFVTPGLELGIRLVSLNATNGAPDNEVDFDDVQLEAVAVPEPGTWVLLVVGILGMVGARKWFSGGRVAAKF